MKNLTIPFVALALLITSSCAKIYYSPDAYTLAQNHKTIAIIPPTVSIAATKKIDGESLKEQQKTESINFQKEMYAWLLKRKMQNRFSPEIQDITTTNAKLANAGYPEVAFSTEELCEILGVDGIMTSNYGLSKPISEGAAVALYLLVGASGATNEVHVTLSINDCDNVRLIWNYDHKFSGSIGSSTSRIVDQLMRQASTKMPYNI